MTTAEAIRWLNVAALVAVMSSIGLKVTCGEVLASMKRIGPILLGLAANFVFVPLLTILLLIWFQPVAPIVAGFLILAVCPGAPVGPSFTAVAKGDVPLAAGLMVLLAGLSTVIAPQFLSVALTRLSSSGEMHFDRGAMVRLLLATQLIPLLAALALHQYLPNVAAKLRRPLTFLGNVLLLAVVALILVTQYELLASIRLRGWAGMSVLFVGSLAAGLVCGRRESAVRSALAVTTGLRNAAVGLVIATDNFPNTPAVTAVTAYSLLSIFGTLTFSILLGKISTSASTELPT